MSKSVRTGRLLDAREARQVEAASRALDLLPVGTPASEVFEALRGCVPLAAGLFSIIRPTAPEALMSHAVNLPQEIVESWLGTSYEQLARTLAPMISSRPGDLWRDSETITGAQREQLEVLHKLDGFGLGEGAGYKILERRTPWEGPEHYMLALLMGRGESVPARAQAMLAALNPAIHAAVLRIGLMLVARESILKQIVEDDSCGYVCISREGRVLEANRRAHDLLVCYRDVAGLKGQRKAMTDFAKRARDMTSEQRRWYLMAPTSRSLLEVKAHRLAKESHALPEDVVLVMMKKVDVPSTPPPSHEHPVLEKLTPSQRQVALLLVYSSDSYKQIADRLERSEGTIRTHAEDIYKRLGVHSRPELVALFR